MVNVEKLIEEYRESPDCEVNETDYEVEIECSRFGVKEKIYIDKDEGKIYYLSYDIDSDEIPNITAEAQHDAVPFDLEELKEDLERMIGKEELEKANREAVMECRGRKGEEFEDCVYDKLYDVYIDAMEKYTEREIREWKSQKGSSMNIDHLVVTKKPVVAEEWCPVNIPHYHYYKAVQCEIPIGIPDDKWDDVINWCEKL